MLDVLRHMSRQAVAAMTSTEVHWRDRLRALGFDSITAFAAARPGASMVELADELGDLTPTAELHATLLDEARAQGELVRCARALLVREVHAQLDGWPTLVDHDGRTALGACLLAWAANLGGHVPELRQRAIDVALELLDAPLPAGWMPTDADDEVLLDVFRRRWA